MLPTLKSRLLAREALVGTVGGHNEALTRTAEGRVEFATERARCWLSSARQPDLASHLRWASAFDR